MRLFFVVRQNSAITPINCAASMCEKVSEGCERLHAIHAFTRRKLAQEHADRLNKLPYCAGMWRVQALDCVVRDAK